ncbi:hypothetical protein ACIHFE_30000 [Streptomyces sp. NPDC052396]|uniref:hypothetical protein n=1 Tax=Streptomyces sp. NPDC052396 TaxID=3365689 RepID=UPI0037CEA9AF
MTAPDQAPVLILDGLGTRRVALLLFWPHPLGGQAHCLARLVLGTPTAPAVAVLSELSSNPDSRGLVSDMPGAARAFVQRMSPYGAPAPEKVVWLAHHSSFSSPDDDGGRETYTRVQLTYRDGTFHDDLAGHHLLSPQQVQEQVVPLGLHPVPEVLAELRSVRI